MSEISNLAQNFSKKSKEQAKLIEDQISSDLAKMSQSMTEQLDINKAIMSSATASLSESSKLIEDYEQQIIDLVDTSLLTVRTHTQKALSNHKAEIAQMMSDHSSDMKQLVSEKELRFLNLISTKLWITLSLSLLLFLVGLGNGIMWG